jgi:quinol-cytochrome oxidoreductase complex cytochrome b subunit
VVADHDPREPWVDVEPVFPDHWSFFLGELALYSFIILIITGVYLTFFFHPGLSESVYHGSYVKLHGIKMSEAYKSTLAISFDIRGGLLIRQIHRWAALVFIAAIAIHALRIFFTARSAGPGRSTGSSGRRCSSSPASRDSSATHCLTICCPARACGSPKASRSRSR